MKNLLKQKFLPVNYAIDLSSSFQDLKQKSKTVVEYSKEFLTMQAHVGLNGDDDVSVDIYFHRLRVDIQHILTFKHFDIVDEVVQHAIKGEHIANYQVKKFNASKWVVQKNSSLQDSKPNGSFEKVFSKSEGQNQITCFNYN